MGVSSEYGKLYTALMLRKFFEAKIINSVVDVGAGSGTYSNLLRPLSNGATWTAVEVWDEYIKKFHLHDLYDQVISNDIRQVDLPSLKADLYVFGDVIEHMPKEDAQALVSKAVSASKMAIISIPVMHWPQDEVNGNPYERHIKDDWSNTEFIASFDNIVSAFVHVYIGVYFLSSDIKYMNYIKELHNNISSMMVSNDKLRGTILYASDVYSSLPINDTRRSDQH